MKKIFTLLLIFFSIQTHAFDFKSIDWFDSSIGFAINPRSNIRPSNIYVLNANYFYTNAKTIFEPIPIIFFRFANIFINKDGGGVAFAHFKNFKLRALITVDGEGYKSLGMENRPNSIFLGGLVKFHLIQVKYLKDINSKSEGQTLRIDLFKENHWGNLLFEPHIGIQFWDKKFVDYYYGVKNSESTSTRKAYFPKGAFNYTFELRYIYTQGNVTYIAIPMYKKYGTQVSHSPTVERDEEFRFTVGAIWKLF